MGEEWVSGLRDPNNAERNAQDNATANFRFVTPAYFQAMGIPLRRGRLLEEGDQGRTVGVISERAARYLWGNENPIGRHVRGAGLQKPSLEVVGVVGDVRGKPEDEPPMMVYEHFWRMQPIVMSFVLRTQADAATVASAIRSTLSSGDPEMAISPARTMEQILEASVATRRFQMYLAVVFAMSALGLSSLGIYGVISFAVARRTQELGIRIALGASGRQLVGMVVRQGMVPVVGGLVAGLGCALLMSRFLTSQLYEVRPTDPFAIGGVVVLLLGVALLACWCPARRATRINPLVALRTE
jgi:predicted permease